ncbi:MAG TPA: PHP-associated domain-containing protein [Candidatus Atribacteria bacterium]|nr:PHP-associated domain-containing protein [Candidatus Atribacteria bacterium]
MEPGKTVNAAGYLYDTHVHTSQGSACGRNTGAEMVRAYAEAGYAGIIITDHFFNGNTAVPLDLPWEQRVELFVKGYEDALEEGNRIGFQVFLGWEYAYKGTEFLTYGLDKEFLLSHPDMLSWSLEKYLTISRASGGFISHAHPFREAPYIGEIRLYPEYVDSVEVINTSHAVPEYDMKAFDYAKRNSLLMTSGSDAHRIDHIKGGGLVFPHRLSSIQDFIDSIRAGDYSLSDRHMLNS